MRWVEAYPITNPARNRFPIRGAEFGEFRTAGTTPPIKVVNASETSGTSNACRIRNVDTERPFYSVSTEKKEKNAA
jgi:hypothetical protein